MERESKAADLPGTSAPEAFRAEPSAVVPTSTTTPSRSTATATATERDNINNHNETTPSSTRSNDRVYAGDLGKDDVHFDLMAVLISIILGVVILVIKGVIVAELWNYVSPELLSRKTTGRLGILAGIAIVILFDVLV